MNLKQNFIESLKTLILNDPECELKIDYETENCSNTKKGRKTCNQHCQKCSFNQTVTVDLALIGCTDGAEYYYSFIGSRNKHKFCTYIGGYLKMHHELRYLNEHVIGQEQKEDLEYYKMIEELKQYSNEFFKEIIDKCFPSLDSKILPIRFHMFAKDFDEYKKERQTGGRLSLDGKQNIIDIYHANLATVESLKSSIRHEIIHYALYVSNCSCTDDSGIFHALSKVYDAGAYVEMNDHEQKIYNIFFKMQKTSGNELSAIVRALGSLDEFIVKARNKLIDDIERSNLKEVI